MTNMADMSWNEHYRTHHTPWDLGHASPVVMRAAEVITPPARLFVPGCGRGWEVEALAARGHAVTGLDLAPAAIELLRARLAESSAGQPAAQPSGTVDLRVGDLLDLPPELDGAFDGWVEHTCFCALDPALLPRYVAAAARLLRPGGHFVGAFLHFDRPGGPPYGTHAAAVRALFEPAFDIDHLAPAPEPFPPAGVPQLEARFRRRS
jgi:SAM-dependent methyltransferase